MSARLVLSPAAKRDLREIWIYVAASNPDAASEIVRDLFRIARLLGDNSLAGRRRSELQAGLRSFPTGAYVVFYRPIPDGIELHRVLHGSRDISPADF